MLTFLSACFSWPCKLSRIQRQQCQAFFFRRNMSIKQREEFVAKDKLDPLECVRCEPPITLLKSSLRDFDDPYEISRVHTLHASLRSSSCSIISFSIGSWISQSWKAAVSFVTVLPSKMCALWSFERRDKSASAPASRAQLRCLLLHTACLRYPVQFGHSRCPPELLDGG